MLKYEVSKVKIKEILLLKTLKEMSPKWAKKAHFGDISYNVFNRRISLIFKVETSYFYIYCRDFYLTK